MNDARSSKSFNRTATKAEYRGARRPSIRSAARATAGTRAFEIPRIGTFATGAVLSRQVWALAPPPRGGPLSRPVGNACTADNLSFGDAFDGAPSRAWCNAPCWTPTPLECCGWTLERGVVLQGDRRRLRRGVQTLRRKRCRPALAPAASPPRQPSRPAPRPRCDRGHATVISARSGTRRDACRQARRRVEQVIGSPDGTGCRRASGQPGCHTSVSTRWPGLRRRLRCHAIGCVLDDGRRPRANPRRGVPPRIFEQDRARGSRLTSAPAGLRNSGGNGFARGTTNLAERGGVLQTAYGRRLALSRARRQEAVPP